MTDSTYSILIDTNAMAKLSIYVGICECAVKEFGTGLDEIKEVLNSKKINKYCEIDEIKKGYDLLVYLKKKYNEFNGNIVIWFSSLSEIELLHLFLEKTFDQELTRRHVPYLARRKRFLRYQVDFDYENEVLRRWETIKEKTNDADIGFRFPERERENNYLAFDIGEIAEMILKYAVLDPVDLYLYALGICLMVDEIYTHDKEFSEIINKIMGEWKHIGQNIQNDLKEKWPRFREEFEKTGKIRLPRGTPR